MTFTAVINYLFVSGDKQKEVVATFASIDATYAPEAIGKAYYLIKSAIPDCAILEIKVQQNPS